MNHPALVEHPKYIEQMKVAAAVEARADGIREQVLARQREVDQAARDQEAAVARAVSEGTAVPATPAAPAATDNLQAALMLIRSEQAAVTADTERLVAEIAGDVESELRKAVAAEMAAVREHAHAVEQSRLGVETALATAARVRRAVENGSASITRPSRADRTRDHLDTAALLDLARTGADVLEPFPVGHRVPKILGVAVGDDHVPTRAEQHAALVASLPTETQDALRRQVANAGRF